VNGRRCELQGDVPHAKEFNHICDPTARPPAPEPTEPVAAPAEQPAPPPSANVGRVHVHIPPMPSSDPSEQIVEDMLLPSIPTSLTLPILQVQGDINMDDEAEVERQMEQYLNLEVGVAAAV